MNLIASNWETERLFVRDVVLETDLENIQSLWESSAYIGKFDGYMERNKNDMYHQLNKGDLPPGGTKEHFKLQAIFTKEIAEMIGYITIYHGYPDNETVWITFFYIYSKIQGQGYGREVINQLTIEAEKSGFRRAMLTVALKNWAAIRFWTNAGFDKIIGVHGDKTYGDNSFSNLTLEKSFLKDSLP